MPKPQQPQTPDSDLEALALVAAWQRARNARNYVAAAQAERELEQLGYVLRAIRPVPDTSEEAQP